MTRRSHLAVPRNPRFLNIQSKSWPRVRRCQCEVLTAAGMMGESYARNYIAVKYHIFSTRVLGKSTMTQGSRCRGIRSQNFRRQNHGAIWEARKTSDNAETACLDANGLEFGLGMNLTNHRNEAAREDAGRSAQNFSGVTLHVDEHHVRRGIAFTEFIKRRGFDILGAVTDL